MDDFVIAMVNAMANRMKWRRLPFREGRYPIEFVVNNDHNEVGIVALKRRGVAEVELSEYGYRRAQKNGLGRFVISGVIKARTPTLAYLKMAALMTGIEPTEALAKSVLEKRYTR